MGESYIWFGKLLEGEIAMNNDLHMYWKGN
jgi:hypothetical protein